MKQQFIKEYKLQAKPTLREPRLIEDSRDSYEEFLQLYDPNTMGLYETAYALYLNQ